MALETDPARPRLISRWVRRLVWRLRHALMGQLYEEVAGLRAEVVALRTEVRERMANEAELERALLTLALDREVSAPNRPRSG